MRCLFRENTINLLSVSRNSPTIHYLYPQFTVNSLSFPRIHYILSISRIIFETNFDFANSLSISRKYHKLGICYVIKLWIHSLFRDVTMNLLSISRINYKLAICFVISLSSTKIYFGFTIFLRIRYEFTIYLADSLWIHLVFREVTMNSLSFSRKYHEFNICFVIALWIHYLFREYTLVSLFFCEFIMNKFYFSQFRFEFSLFYANYLYVWRINYESTWFFAKLPWIHYLFRSFTMNLLSVSRINYK